MHVRMYVWGCVFYCGFTYVCGWGGNIHCCVCLHVDVPTFACTLASTHSKQTPIIITQHHHPPTVHQQHGPKMVGLCCTALLHHDTPMPLSWGPVHAQGDPAAPKTPVEFLVGVLTQVLRYLVSLLLLLLLYYVCVCVLVVTGDTTNSIMHTIIGTPSSTASSRGLAQHHFKGIPQPSNPHIHHFLQPLNFISLRTVVKAHTTQFRKAGFKGTGNVHEAGVVGVTQPEDCVMETSKHVGGVGFATVRGQGGGWGVHHVWGGLKRWGWFGGRLGRLCRVVNIQTPTVQMILHIVILHIVTHSARYNTLGTLQHTRHTTTHSARYNTLSTLQHTRHATTHSARYNTLGTLQHTRHATTHSAHYNTLGTLQHTRHATTHSAHYNTLGTLQHTQHITTHSAHYNTLGTLQHTASVQMIWRHYQVGPHHQCLMPPQ